MKSKLIFKVEYGRNKINFLDTTVYLNEGRLEIDLYAKATDAHLYLLPGSCHPPENTAKIPYGVALRLRRICSQDETFEHRSKEYIQYFINRDYDGKNVKQQFNKVNAISRPDSLKKSQRQKRDIIPFIAKYDPRLPNLRAIISRNLKHLYSDPSNKILFLRKSLVVGYNKLNKKRRVA